MGSMRSSLPISQRGAAWRFISCQRVWRSRLSVLLWLRECGGKIRSDEGNTGNVNSGPGDALGAGLLTKSLLLHGYKSTKIELAI